MCLIAFALDPDHRYRLVMVANRDEFHHRPTRAMHWWTDPPVLAGRDEQSGGTWLAITPGGRVAAVTNFRSPRPETARKSRGELPLRLLESDSMDQTLEQIRKEQAQYGQFNLLGYDGSVVHSLGSESRLPPRRLESGVHGLSNHLLNTPWPKLQHGCDRLQEALDAQPTDTASLHRALLDHFGDTREAEPHRLPDTGVGEQLERMLSPVFIKGANYGTRATTVVTMSRDGGIMVTERCYGGEGVDGGEQRFSWQQH